MLIKKAPDVRSSEITDPSRYFSRRRFLRSGVGTVVAASTLGGTALLRPGLARAGTPLPGPIAKSPFSTAEEKTPYQDVTTYNNF